MRHCSTVRLLLVQHYSNIEKVKLRWVSIALSLKSCLHDTLIKCCSTCCWAGSLSSMLLLCSSWCGSWLWWRAYYVEVCGWWDPGDPEGRVRHHRQDMCRSAGGELPSVLLHSHHHQPGWYLLWQTKVLTLHLWWPGRQWMWFHC